MDGKTCAAAVYRKLNVEMLDLKNSVLVQQNAEICFDQISRVAWQH